MSKEWEESALDKLANLPKQLQDEIDEHEREPAPCDELEIEEDIIVPKKYELNISDFSQIDNTVKEFVKKGKKKVEPKPKPEPVKVEIEPEPEVEETPKPVLDKFIKSQLPALRAIFNSAEIDMFIGEYTQLVAQFKEDVLFSEYLAVFNLVKFSILMHRNMLESKQLIDYQSRLDKLAQSHAEDESDDPGRINRSLEIGKQAADIRAAIKIKSEEFLKLNKQYGDMMEALKITRSQRIKSLEGVTKSFVDVIQQLVIEENAKELSAKNTAFQIAMAKERERLTQLHEFKDGTVVEPIMNSDIVAKHRPVYTNEHTPE